LHQPLLQLPLLRLLQPFWPGRKLSPWNRNPSKKSSQPRQQNRPKWKPPNQQRQQRQPKLKLEVLQEEDAGLNYFEIQNDSYLAKARSCSHIQM
jgi:hypothetical protein